MILNDLPSRDKGHHIMVTKILKENYQKYYKRLTKKYAKILNNLQPGLFKGTTYDGDKSAKRKH